MSKDITKYREELESIIHKYLTGEIKYNEEMFDLLDDMEDRMQDELGYSLDNPMKDGSPESRITNISIAIKCDIEEMNEGIGNALDGIINLCYEHLGRKPILHITGEGRLEGGDYILQSACHILL